jgi:hypothetical protein
VTFRYAARFAEELNLVFLGPDGVAELLPIIRQRCEEVGRDPSTLRVSLYTRDVDVERPGQARVDLLGALRDLGLDRVISFPTRYGPTVEVQALFAEDCLAAGLPLNPTAVEAA